MVARRTSDGVDSVVLLPPPNPNPNPADADADAAPPRLVPQPCVAISSLCRHGDGIAYIGAPPDGPPNIWALSLTDSGAPSGYGRTFRCSLWGLWGVADAEDCVDAARHLAEQGVVDPTHMAIRGSSPGGLTALNALAGDECFAAAVTWYGVTDLLALAASTHDFEAHYMDRLVGPLPECRETYEARSPTRRIAEIQGSVLLLQGLDDLVVPPPQTAGLHDALLARGRRCEVRYFEGEGHGFRRADTLVAALQEELAFYRRERRL
jgi:dipeptidyl aminopeptidase/acylaminoacyl peptidase